MTSANLTHRSTSPRPGGADGDQPRLQLKPESATTTGFVDGGWWPRSRDLSTELPTLLAALAHRLGPVERVSYHLTDWDPANSKITIDGAVVRLAGFRSQRPDTVDLIGAARRVTLLVVPPDATAGTADRALTSAAQQGNTDGISDLLASPADAAPAQQR